MIRNKKELEKTLEEFKSGKKIELPNVAWKLLAILYFVKTLKNFSRLLLRLKVSTNYLYRCKELLEGLEFLESRKVGRVILVSITKKGENYIDSFVNQFR